MTDFLDSNPSLVCVFKKIKSEFGLGRFRSWLCLFCPTPSCLSSIYTFQVRGFIHSPLSISLNVTQLYLSPTTTLPLFSNHSCFQEKSSPTITLPLLPSLLILENIISLFSTSHNLNLPLVTHKPRLGLNTNRLKCQIQPRSEALELTQDQSGLGLGWHDK